MRRREIRKKEEEHHCIINEQTLRFAGEKEKLITSLTEKSIENDLLQKKNKVRMSI